MRILILSFSPIASDPRVQRQLRAFCKSHQVIVAGFATTPEADAGIPLIPIGKRRTRLAWKLMAFFTLLIGLYRVHYWFQLEFPRRALQHLKAGSFDLVLANDVNTLPLAFSLAAGAPVCLDAHEFSPSEFSSLSWRLSLGRFYDWICRRFLPRVSTMSTVCPGLSDLYGRTYGRRADLIVLNVPLLQQELTEPTFDLKRLHQRVRLVHHGIADPERKLEMMVQMLDLLDSRFNLDMFLVGSDSNYAHSLLSHCRDVGRLCIHAPIPRAELCQVLSTFDLGVYLLPPLSLNNQYALPNKLFEFIHAGLAIAIGPSPEMAAIVRSEDVGIVAPTFDPASLAACLNALDPEQIFRMRLNAWSARKRYTSQVAERSIASWVDRAHLGAAERI